MKLVIQIPCLDEARTLPATLAALPRSVPGFDSVDLVIVDDGSTDGTSDVARAHGVRHVVRFPRRRGLSRAFVAGLDAAVRLGADVIVNTDADNQYCGGDIPGLVAPILAGKADIVIGDRQIGKARHVPTGRKLLQKFGSFVVRLASDTDVPDATSGFRALTRDAALRLFVVDDFTYTLETIIHAGQRQWAIAHVPVRTNAATRPSRLFRSAAEYVRRSAATILRIHTMYRPLRAFLAASAVCFLAGVGLGARFLFYYIHDPGRSGHVQSLVLAAIFLVASFQLALSGVVADLTVTNRKLLEDVLYRVRSIEADRGDREPGGPAAGDPPPPGSR